MISIYNIGLPGQLYWTALTARQLAAQPRLDSNLR